MTPFDVRAALRLYAVTDRSWLGGRALAEVTDEILAGGATFLQLREKELKGEALLAQARALKAVAARHHVPFVVNDDVEAALAVDADGVHVGQDDIMGRDIRALIGPDKILGMTARTVEAALAAQRAGADYLGVGAVFGTTTKKNARPLSLDELRAICAAVDIPVVAIGGVNAENILELRGSGAAGAAVVSGLYAQPHPGAAAKRLRELADRAFGEQEEQP